MENTNLGEEVDGFEDDLDLETDMADVTPHAEPIETGIPSHAVNNESVVELLEMVHDMYDNKYEAVMTVARKAQQRYDIDQMTNQVQEGTSPFTHRHSPIDKKPLRVYLDDTYEKYLADPVTKKKHQAQEDLYWEKRRKRPNVVHPQLIANLSDTDDANITTVVAIKERSFSSDPGFNG